MKYYSPNSPANLSIVYEYLDWSTYNTLFIDYETLFGGWDAWANEAFKMDKEASSFKAFGKYGASITRNAGFYLYIIVILMIVTFFFGICKASAPFAKGRMK